MRTIRTPARRARFLEQLSKLSNVTAACDAAGIARTAAYKWKAEDPEFAEAWEAALELGVQGMEDEAKRRAFDGYEEPVYQGGMQVGSVRKYSDSLAAMMLKAHAPDKYRERSDLNISGSLNVRNMSEAELEAEVAAAKLAGLVDGETDDADAP